MAEKPKSLLEGGPRDGLGEGAARLDRLIESVKASQQPAAEAPSPGAPAPNPLLHASPGEAWAKRFQAQSIGPEPRGLAPSDLVRIPERLITPVLETPAIVPARAEAGPRPVAPVVPADVAPRRTTGQLGAQIGKPEKRRSWLGRLFRGEG